MADERRIENHAAAELKPDHNDGSSEKLSSSIDGKGFQPVSTTPRFSLVDSTSSNKGKSRSFKQFDNHRYTQKGMQPDHSSLVYYLPGYNPYAFGAQMGMEGEYFRQQQYFSSSGYPQQPVSYGSEASPHGARPFSRNTNQGVGTARPKPSGFPFTRANGELSRNYSGPINQTRESYQVPHYGSHFSAGLVKEHHPTFNNSRRDVRIQQDGATNYRPNGMIWNGKDRLAYKPNRNGEFEMKPELTCGPRSSNKYASPEPSVEKKELGFSVRRDQYNQKDFIVEYENAKFFIIKSYSEDDIHKSIKYGVWTSTPNGNKRLDAAYRDVEARTSDTGTECPLFLFYSVNGSGQFVGVAEMLGMVDFDKDMNFWQVDKWNGFFPVKWHIIKDVPNSQLRHIILENNDNRSVTFTRDTHEVELKQGLEMLKIFKSYDGKMSLLDDFNFYESREKPKSLDGKKNAYSASGGSESYKDDILKPASSKEVDASGGMERVSNPGSLIKLTRNLSLRESSMEN